jgi:hypothetical protein
MPQLVDLFWSGRLDSNQRPPAPHAGAQFARNKAVVYQRLSSGSILALELARVSEGHLGKSRSRTRRYKARAKERKRPGNLCQRLGADN